MEVIEIWQIILDLLDLKSQIRLISVSKFYNAQLYINDLLEPDLLKNINNTDILLQRKFQFMRKLYMFEHYSDIELWNFKQLQILHIDKSLDPALITTYSQYRQLKLRKQGINPKSMYPNLIELDITNTGYVWDNIVSCMKQLKVLHTNNLPSQFIYEDTLASAIYPGLERIPRSKSAISQDTINKLDLTELYISNNCSIFSLSHFTNLQVLDASGTKSTITQDCINLLNLVKLYVSDNININNVSHMTKLEVFHADGKNCITPISLSNLDLRELSIVRDGQLYFPYFKNLKLLKVSHTSIVSTTNINRMHFSHTEIISSFYPGIVSVYIND